MNIFKQIAKISTSVLLSLVTVLVLSSATVQGAVPYTGDTTPPAATPTFNNYTGVPGEGNEADFLRGRPVSDTTSINDVNSTCETGKRFLLRIYVHNNASQFENGNGNGPSVAKNSKVKVNLPTGDATKFTPSATISATNAATVTDTMNITCSDGRKVSLSYVNDTAEQYNQVSGVQKINDDTLFTTGSQIGTMSPNGDMWGCWDQRVLVRLIVEVKEVPVTIPQGTAICILDNKAFTVSDDRKVKVSIDAQTTNATKTGKYQISWGDGSTSDKQTDTHTYSKDGTYTIQGQVEVTITNSDGTKTTKWVNDASCKKVVTFKAGQPPVVPPTTTVTMPPSGKLADTGAGSMFGIFAAVSMVGAFAHRIYMARKAAQL